MRRTDRHWASPFPVPLSETLPLCQLRRSDFLGSTSLHRCPRLGLFVHHARISVLLCIRCVRVRIGTLARAPLPLALPVCALLVDPIVVVIIEGSFPTGTTTARLPGVALTASRYARQGKVVVWLVNTRVGPGTYALKLSQSKKPSLQHIPEKPQLESLQSKAQWCYSQHIAPQ